MAISRIKNWVAEILEPTDLNAEFNNILNNATSLISPLTANLAAGSNKITGLAAATANGDAVRYEQLGWTLIQTQDASASATIDFTSGLSTTYSQYIILLKNIVPVTNDVELWLRVSQSAAFLSGASDYWYTWLSHTTAPADTNESSSGNTRLQLSTAMSNVASKSLSGMIQFSDPAGTGNNKSFIWRNVWGSSAATLRGSSGVGEFQLNTTAIDGLRFLMSTGSIASGTFALYGVRKT